MNNNTSNTKPTPGIHLGFLELHKVGGNRIAIPGWPDSLEFSGKCGPYFVDVVEGKPVISHAHNMRQVRDTDPLMVQVEPRGRNRQLMVVALAFKDSWDAAVRAIKKAEEAVKREIANRPRFRVMRDNLLKGKKTANQNENVFEGTLEEMLAVSPRDGLLVSTKDQFAPRYEPGLSVSGINRFLQRNKQGQWVKCEDPRPLPADIYRLVLAKKGEKGKIEEKILAQGPLATIEAEYPRNATDKLQQYETAESDGWITWYRSTTGDKPRKEGFVRLQQYRFTVVTGASGNMCSLEVKTKWVPTSSQKYTMVETADPRFKIQQAEAIIAATVTLTSKAAAPSAKPVEAKRPNPLAMPKRVKTERVVTSLHELEEALTGATANSQN